MASFLLYWDVWTDGGPNTRTGSVHNATGHGEETLSRPQPGRCACCASLLTAPLRGNQNEQKGGHLLTAYRPFLGALWRTLENRGIQPERVIERKLYSPDPVPTRYERMPLQEQERLYLEILDLTGDEALGVHLGEHLLPAHLGALGHAWLASSSLETALRRAQRYGHMLNESIQVELAERPGELKLAVVFREPTRCMELRADFQLSGVVTLCRAMVGREFAPSSVRLRRTEPANRRPWDDFFGTEVRFGAAENALCIPTAVARRSSTGSNPTLVALHEEVIERQLAQLRRESIGNRARFEIIDSLASGGVNESHVAEALHLSTRSMHRKLRAEGLTFSGLVRDVRRSLALKYIEEPGYSITEIAFLLGYADTSAFSRAFRSWFGRSPTEARRAAGL
jgi:AraC-like DNA-binding protein